jgi:hypothetical protein
MTTRLSVEVMALAMVALLFAVTLFPVNDKVPLWSRYGPDAEKVRELATGLMTVTVPPVPLKSASLPSVQTPPESQSGVMPASHVPLPLPVPFGFQVSIAPRAAEMGKWASGVERNRAAARSRSLDRTRRA